MGKTPRNRSKSSAAPIDSPPVKSAARTRHATDESPADALSPLAAERALAADQDAPRIPDANLNLQVAPPVIQPATGPAKSAQAATAAAPPNKRFDIFIVDVGWHSPVGEAVRKNIELCLRYEANSTTYVLTNEQCMQLFKMRPAMIGTEPSIIFIDREACAAKRTRGFGFKLNFGLIRDVPTANNLLKWILAVLAEQKPGSDITEPIRAVIHKEGFRGAVDILADITRSPVGETVTH